MPPKLSKIAVTLCIGIMVSTSASAGQIGSGGVSSVKSNGKISGNPSWSIRCDIGSGIVIRKDGKWTDSSGYSFSDRLWNLSLENFAKKMCE